MPSTLTKEHRNLLSDITLKAREAAEEAARAALENLAVHEKDYRPHMNAEQRQLRNRLRARGRALGDRRDASGSQGIAYLSESVAYEQWHRLLFTRFLAENHLLHTDEENGIVPVTLAECEELAAELDARDGFDLACRFASKTLPGIFRRDDPVLELRLAPNHEVKLRRLLDELPAELFRADDALGWTYQFWQAKRKDQVNRSGVKIGSDELSAVTQLFTEDYMVEFLLHNSLGAWWAGRKKTDAVLETASVSANTTEAEARRWVSLPPKDGLPGVDWAYLRFVQTPDSTPEVDADPERLTTDHSPLTTASWAPAAGTFDGWPTQAAHIRFLDPCMGSGHFLVFALPILARLRMEQEGLTGPESVAAVLRDNLHGLELDERCTQIAAFNVALTAWKLGGYQTLPPLHLACSGLAPHATEKDWIALAAGDDRLERGMARLYALFNNAPVLGSLINPNNGEGDLLDADFHELQPLLAEALKAEKARDDEGRELGVVAEGLAKAAELLAGKFTLVATNVPYLARGKQNEPLKEFCERHYPEAKNDLANVFLERCLTFAGNDESRLASISQPPSFRQGCRNPASMEGKPEVVGVVQVVMPQNWLFLTSYRKQREKLLKTVSWNLLARLGAGAFETISGEVVNAILLTQTHTRPSKDFKLCGMDASTPRTVVEKADALRRGNVLSVEQLGQLKNPDGRVSFSDIQSANYLYEYADYGKGSTTGDSPRFLLCFWELYHIGNNLLWLDSPTKDDLWSGRNMICTESLDSISITTQLGCWIRGQEAWGKHGVAVNKMRELEPMMYCGEVFDDNICPIVPKDKSHITPILLYIQNNAYRNKVRDLDQKLNVTAATLVKVPFDLDYWQQIAAEKYPNGLPKPHSDDPTQWLFNGHPQGSEHPLQVAVARLLGYQWPRQTGSEFPDCPALGPDGLEEYADADGIVCLPPINREQAAASRLRSLLAAALVPSPNGHAIELCDKSPSPLGESEARGAKPVGVRGVESEASLPIDRPPPNLPPSGGGTNATALHNAGGWGRVQSEASLPFDPPHPNPLPQGEGTVSAFDETALLTAAGAKSKTLEDWLRDEFFEQHCKLFHHRPFIWHIWDGRKDGFHALVNYHQLDYAKLSKLTYSYLGDWIRQQESDAKADKPGAAERLGAARALEAELINILEGEPPYDLFIRWKPLKDQPMGWQPDLNDGVRLNIRPFMRATDVAKKGAGVLRAKPNIKWDKDRGNEPHRDKAEYPWFWHDEPPPTDCLGGQGFTGNRWNDVHFSLARKKVPRNDD